MTADYWLVSFVFSLTAFAAFRIHSALPRYLSFNDVLNLIKAVIVAELMTTIALFTLTRLQGIPRSVPPTHALIVGIGLLVARGVIRIADRKAGVAKRFDASEHIILIGLNDLSFLFLKFLKSEATGRRQVIAVLDQEPRWKGRTIMQVSVFGPPSQLEALIEEFSVHGVRTDRVVIATKANALSESVRAEIARVCASHHLDLVFLGDLFGGLFSDRDHSCADIAVFPANRAARPALVAAPYFFFKRVVDIVIALVISIALLPVLIAATLLAMVDVGVPVLFWQRRVGLEGRPFHIYKFRTLRPSHDRNGQKIPIYRRLSWIGRLMRHTRLDELPQLLNVLVGHMSLVGPRPLLPHDQPVDPRLRLAVRPGITGWAQINGGASLGPEEKEILDEWYIHHATLWMDLHILVKTLLVLIRGDQRSGRAVAPEREEDPDGSGQSFDGHCQSVPTARAAVGDTGLQADGSTIRTS